MGMRVGVLVCSSVDAVSLREYLPRLGTSMSSPALGNLTCHISLLFSKFVDFRCWKRGKPFVGRENRSTANLF